MKVIIKHMTHIEAVWMFGAYAQACALKHQVPLTFLNWLRNQRIQLETPVAKLERLRRESQSVGAA